MAELYENDVYSTLASAIGAGDLSLTVASATGFPASGTFAVRVDDEVMTVTAVSGTTFTVTRATEAVAGVTAAAAHASGAEVHLVLTKRSLAAIAAEAVDLTTCVILAPTTDARNVIQPTDAAVKALVLKGAASQSDNLLELQNDSGTTLSRITSTGTVRAYLGSASDVAYGFQGAAGQTGFFAYASDTKIDMVSNTTLAIRFGVSGAGLAGIQLGPSSRYGLGQGIGFSDDIGYGRSAAGIGKITNGSTGYGSLILGADDAATTTATTCLTIGHNTSGTAAAGFGNSIVFQLESSTTADQSAGLISCSWITATHASRASRLDFSTYYTSTAQEGLRIDANADGFARVGIGGAALAAGQLQVTSQTAADKGIVIKGAASQSGNLLETQNSSGTTSAYIDKFGRAALNAGDLCGSEATAVLLVQGTGVGYGIRLYRGSINFDLQNDGTFPYIGTQSNHSFVFMTNNTGRLYVNSAGKVRIGGTSATPTGQLDVDTTDTATDSVTTLLTLNHNTSGTAAAGFGGGLVFRLESSTTEYTTAGLISCSWTDATHASRTSSLSLSAYYTSTAEEGLRVIANSDGNARTYVPYRLGVATTDPSAPLHVRATTSTWTPCAWLSDQNSTLGAGVYFEWRGGAANNKVHSWLADSYGLSWYRMNDSGNSFVRTGPIPDLLIDTNGRVGIGVIPTLAAALHVRETDTATNSISNVLCLAHTTTGAVDVGFGNAILFHQESSTTEAQTAGKITSRWGVHTHASREGIVAIIATDYNGDRTGFEVTGNGTATEIGFYGVTPVARPSAYTQTYSTSTKTHAALTSATLTDNSGGTANTTVQALTDPADTPASADALRDDLVANLIPELRNNFADLVAQINALRVDLENAKQVLNASIDDDQSQGLKQ